MSFFKNLFGNKKEIQEKKPEFIVITLNDKIQPIDRGEYYENGLEKLLLENNIGEITGGGTMQHQSGEIDFVDIEIELSNEEISNENLNKIILYLEEKGAPKNSKITIEKTNKVINFGKLEGIGVYLDGKNLDEEVYENCDSNFVVSEIKNLIDDKTDIVKFWEGSEKTALYFYGESFIEMKNKISNFINEYPLCKNAEIIQIA